MQKAKQNKNKNEGKKKIQTALFINKWKLTQKMIAFDNTVGRLWRTVLTHCGGKLMQPLLQGDLAMLTFQVDISFH
jgi:hypothetical protein